MRTGRKQMLKWDFGARSPAAWLARRNPTLAKDAAQTQDNIAIVKTFTDELGYVPVKGSAPGCNELDI